MSLSKQNKQVAVLYTSTFLSVAVGVMVSVLNTRSLDPSGYGDYQYAHNIINFIAGFLLFGYFISGSRLLSITESEEERRRIRGGMVAILFVASVLLSVILAATGFVYGAFLNKGNDACLLFYSILIGPNILLINYINTTAQGDNHIVRMAVARLLPSVVYLVAAYFIYKAFGATPLRMLLLQGFIALAIYVVIIITTKPDFRGLKSTLRLINDENKAYGFDVYVGSVANIGLAYLGTIALGLFNSNNTMVAFFTLAVTISGPLQLLPSIIGTVYFRRFANEAKISGKVMRGTLLVTCLSFVGYVILIHPLVRVLYDESYVIVAIYASFLAIAMCVQGFGDMINRFLGSHGRGKEIRNASFISGLLLVFGNTLLVYLFDINGAIATKIIGAIGSCGTLIYYYRKYLLELNI